MSKGAAESDEAVLAALDGIVRMQGSIRRDVVGICTETGLVFLRVYYRNLPEHVARRLSEIQPGTVEQIPSVTAPPRSPEKQRAIGALVASDAAFAQAIRAANVYRGKLGYPLLGPDGTPEQEEVEV